MRAGDFGIAIYRILSSILLGSIIIISIFIAFNYLNWVLYSEGIYNTDINIINETKKFIDMYFKDLIYITLPIVFVVGEIFRVVGEFLLAHFYRFTSGHVERISVYTVFDRNKNVNSFFRAYLMKAFETNNPFLNISEALYSTANFLSGLVVFFFLFNLFILFLLKIKLKSLPIKTDIEHSILIVFFWIIIFPILSSLLIKIYNYLDKLFGNKLKNYNRLEKYLKKLKLIEILLFIVAIVSALVIWFQSLDFLSNIPILGDTIVVFLFILMFLFWHSSVDNVDSISALDNISLYLHFFLYLFYYFLFIVFFYLRVAVFLGVCSQKLDLAILLYFLSYFLITHYISLSILFQKCKKNILILHFIMINIVLIVISNIYYKIKVDNLLVENLIPLNDYVIAIFLFLSHTLTPLFLLLSFVFKTQANEIILGIFKNKK